MPFTITVHPTQMIVAADGAARLDRGLLVLWCAATGLLLLQLARGTVALGRSRDAWRRDDIDGTPVRLSPNVGPAVVGLRSMEVVLPEWILSLDTQLRAIVLCHEEEHRRARDPYLLFGAAVAIALMPWNLALWLQARRLRLAIEMDCDARVLRTHPSPERYGLLMLTIAQRRSVAPTSFAPMLSEPTTQLERRIIAMRMTTKRLARGSAAGAIAVAIIVVAFACSLQPDSPVAPGSVALSSRPKPMHDADVYFEYQVEKQVSPRPGNPAPRYPDAMRKANVEGEVLVQFVVDETGTADLTTFRTLKSTNDLFTNTVRQYVPAMKFYAAEVGGRPVKQVVQMPFQFSLTK
jgi:TonB family protein